MKNKKFQFQKNQKVWYRYQMEIISYIYESFKLLWAFNYF